VRARANPRQDQRGSQAGESPGGAPRPAAGVDTSPTAGSHRPSRGRRIPRRDCAVLQCVASNHFAVALPPHAVSAYSFCDIDSDFWGRPGLPLVLNGGGAPQLSLIIMRLTLEGGVTPEIISVEVRTF